MSRVNRLALPSFVVTEHPSPRLPNPAAIRLPNPPSRNAAGSSPSNSFLCSPLPPPRLHPGTYAPPCRLANTKSRLPHPCLSQPQTLLHVSGPLCQSSVPWTTPPTSRSPLPLPTLVGQGHATGAAPDSNSWRTLSFDTLKTGPPRADPPSPPPSATPRVQPLYSLPHRVYTLPTQPLPRPCRSQPRLPHRRRHRRTAPLHFGNPHHRPSHQRTTASLSTDLHSPPLST